MDNSILDQMTFEEMAEMIHLQAVAPEPDSEGLQLLRDILTKAIVTKVGDRIRDGEEVEIFDGSSGQNRLALKLMQLLEPKFLVSFVLRRVKPSGFRISVSIALRPEDLRNEIRYPDPEAEA